MLMKINHDEQGVGMQNSPYSPAYKEWLHTVNIKVVMSIASSPNTYQVFHNELSGVWWNCLIFTTILIVIK